MLKKTKKIDIVLLYVDLIDISNMKKWIDITYKIPNYDQDVLFYLRNGNILIGYVYIYEGDEVLRCNNCFIPFNQVTHWMPLPKPPHEISVFKK